MCPAPQLAPQPLKVLWMDDQLDSIQTYATILGNKGSELPMNVDVADSIQVARDKINSEEYDAMVVDCRMDNYDHSVSGARFLLEVNESHRFLPTFVYSAWSDDAHYKGDIEKSYAIDIVSKNQRFERPLSRNKFFQALYRCGRRYVQAKVYQPEKIHFASYMQNPQLHSEDVGHHWKKHCYWIRGEMRKRKYLWSVVCGMEMIHGSSDLSDFPNEEALIKLGEKHKLIPFAYTSFIPPEDMNPIPWENTDVTEGDFYPAIEARIANNKLWGDFDTGAFQTFLSDEISRRGRLDFSRDTETEYHLGEPYKYFAKKLNICLFDGKDGTEQSKELTVAVVERWKESSFTKVNKKRKALLGRDLLRTFKMEIYLNSATRETRIRFIK
jgi:hypothetical protein